MLSSLAKVKVSLESLDQTLNLMVKYRRTGSLDYLFAAFADLTRLLEFLAPTDSAGFNPDTAFATSSRGMKPRRSFAGLRVSTSGLVRDVPKTSV
jgi:hypothetical protein